MEERRPSESVFNSFEEIEASLERFALPELVAFMDGVVPYFPTGF